MIEKGAEMKREIYWWLLQLAYNMVMYYNKKTKKWCKEYEKWSDKWKAEYLTGGSGNADTN